MRSGVYIITNIVTGKIYIGSSYDIYRRWISHKSDLNLNKNKNIHLQRAWIKHGAKNFTFNALEFCDISDLLAREQYYLDAYMSYAPDIGYNIAPVAGNSTGIKQSKESIEKRAAKLRGVKHKKETILKRALSNTGKKRTDETKRKLSVSLKGIARTKEWLDNLSKSHIGIRQSDETKMKISAKMKQIRAAKKNFIVTEPPIIIGKLK